MLQYVQSFPSLDVVKNTGAVCWLVHMDYNSAHCTIRSFRACDKRYDLRQDNHQCHPVCKVIKYQLQCSTSKTINSFACRSFVWYEFCVFFFPSPFYSFLHKHRFILVGIWLNIIKWACYIGLDRQEDTGEALQPQRTVTYTRLSSNTTGAAPPRNTRSSTIGYWFRQCLYGITILDTWLLALFNSAPPLNAGHRNIRLGNRHRTQRSRAYGLWVCAIRFYSFFFVVCFPHCACGVREGIEMVKSVICNLIGTGICHTQACRALFVLLLLWWTWVFMDYLMTPGMGILYI